MDRSSVFIEKLGTIDKQIVEANPIVWQGRLYIFEYIRCFPWEMKCTYHGNQTGDSYCRFRDVETNAFTPSFGKGLHFACAYVAEDKVVVTAVNSVGGNQILQTESSDLVHWTVPRVILSGDGWQCFNTSMCKADGRYVLTFERGESCEEVGVPFTMFFAESKDLVTWSVMHDTLLGRDFYTGGPMLRWHGGWFYFFYLDDSHGDDNYETVVARSRDLRKWEWSPRNPVISYCPERDKKITPVYPQEFLDEMLDAQDFNASDLDMCDFKGDVQMVYSWGNQHGNEFLARAIVRKMSEREFCESFF